MICFFVMTSGLFSVCGRMFNWEATAMTTDKEAVTCPACLAWLANQWIKEIAEAKA